jgi:opacity protein-like surface antigen
LLLALVAAVILSPDRVAAQPDNSSTGEISGYGGGIFGINTHPAVGATSAVAMGPYAFLLLDVSYMPLGSDTLRDYRGQLAIQNSALYDFSVSTHIRIPLRAALEPYLILGGGLLLCTYRAGPLNGDTTTILSSRSDENFGFHTGAGVRYYIRDTWGIRGEYRATISNRNYSRVSLGWFYQF